MAEDPFPAEVSCDVVSGPGFEWLKRSARARRAGRRCARLRTEGLREMRAKQDGRQAMERLVAGEKWVDTG
ncbi:hypothetical protein GCM10009744_47790 [Kribbella alba]|uniref:Uncharacterized protein n=1 Tax=Kribbella alba TaxID=190197 RepID=A0ABN2FLG1_9ACTN